MQNRRDFGLWMVGRYFIGLEFFYANTRVLVFRVKFYVGRAPPVKQEQ